MTRLQSSADVLAAGPSSQLAALGAGHRVVGVVALAPGRGGGGVDEPAAVGMRLEFRAGSAAGRSPGAWRSQSTPQGYSLPSLPFDLPAALPVAVGVEHQMPSGQPSLVQSPWMPAELGEVGRVHRVLVDVVAAGEHAHGVQAPRAVPGSPRLLQRMRSMPAACSSRHHLDRVAVPAPDVDRADEEVDVRDSPAASRRAS